MIPGAADRGAPPGTGGDEAPLTVRPVTVTLRDTGLAVFESRHAPSFAMEIDTWPFEKLCLVRRGQGMVRLDGGVCIPLKEGDLLRVPAGVPHAFGDVSGHPMTLTMACYDHRPTAGNAAAEAVAARFRESLPALEPARLSAPHPRGTVTRRFTQMLFDDRRSGDLADHALWCGLLELMHHVGAILAEQRRIQALDRAERGFARSLAYLHESFIHPVRIEQLAAIAGLSYRRYTERFRAQTGETVVAYITALRLDFATRRMRETGNIMMSCLDAGFGDLSSFYRAFKRAYGITPKQFLKAPDAAPAAARATAGRDTARAAPG
ncbi:MAG: helix-turn-helix domain-containing protein [Alphaproteobacteria bacterium]|jgi:AraC-like DNA-binding protein|nr:helix-turn-helix domain-containing protein [Alphaproteobacteria bacterium]